MSGITSIRRDWGDNVTIVRIITTDTIQTALGANYIKSQLANIILANEGPFTWLPTDYVLISCSNGNSPLLQISADFSSLLLISGALTVSVPMTTAQWEGMYAAPFLLIPAPSANQLIVVNSTQWAFDFNTTSFAGGGATQLQYGNTVQGAGTAASASIAAATINALGANTTLNVAGVSSIVEANAVGKGIYISNATGAYTTGDDSWIITVNYNIISG